jgi:large subunit ribosomal protein L1
MASTRTSVAQWGRGALSSSFRPQLQPLRTTTVVQQSRNAAGTTGANSANAAKYKRKELSTAQKKKKQRSSFINHDLKDVEQFSLCDAMRYDIQTIIPPFRPLTTTQIHPRLRSRLLQKPKIRTPRQTTHTQKRPGRPKQATTSTPSQDGRQNMRDLSARLESS